MSIRKMNIFSYLKKPETQVTKDNRAYLDEASLTCIRGHHLHKIANNISNYNTEIVDLQFQCTCIKTRIHVHVYTFSYIV